MTVGEKIQHYRKQKGFSQEELGQQLMVSRQTVSLWEMDKTLPTIDNLVRLKEIFSVSIDELLDTQQTPAEMDLPQNSAEQTLQENGRRKRNRPKGGWRVGSILLFIFSILAFPLAMITLALTATLSETEFVEWHYWVFFVYTVIPIASIIYGILLKKKKFRAKKHFITGGIAMGFLCLFGLIFWGISSTYSHSDALLLRAEERIGIDIPEYRSVQSEKDGYEDGGAKTTKERCTAYFDDEKALKFEGEMRTDGRWMLFVPTELIGITPNDYYSDYEYVLICNTYTKELNALPKESGKYLFISLLYDTEDNKLLIVEYTVECVA